MRCSKTRLSVAKAFNQTVIALAPPPLPTSRQSQPPVATTTTATSGDSTPAAAGVLTDYRDTVCVTAPFVQVTTCNPLPIPIASYPSAPFLLRPTDIYTPSHLPPNHPSFCSAGTPLSPGTRRCGTFTCTASRPNCTRAHRATATRRSDQLGYLPLPNIHRINKYLH